MFNAIPVVIVASMGKDTHAIGLANGLIWHVPADMRRFKELTIGKPIIMGRKTFESILTILGTPLPGRTNIVVTTQADYHAPDDVLVAPSLDAAFHAAAAESPTEIHIGGGAELYRQALPFVDRLHLTFFHDQTPGDTTFPEFRDQFTEIWRGDLQTHDGLVFEWADFARTNPA